MLPCWKAQCPSEMKKPCRLRSNPPLRSGLNIHGYFLSEIGLGESARLLASAATTQNLPLGLVNRELKGRQNAVAFKDRLSMPKAVTASLNVLGINEVGNLLHEICTKQHNIIYPFWELEKLPFAIKDDCNKFDSVWAPSKFIFDFLQSELATPVHLVKQPVDVPATNPLPAPNGESLRFLTYFDFDSFAARKNPEGAILAFQAAFPRERSDVQLTVKARGQQDHGRRSWLAEQAQKDPRITILDKTFSEAEMTTLMLDHHAFISLHRSEGFGLGCAEALIAGRSVICTDYGGTRDFITKDTGYPVEWRYVDLREGDYVGWEGARWADPSIEQAASSLQAIYDQPEKAKQKTLNGVDLLRREHSFEAVGKVISRTLAASGL